MRPSADSNRLAKARMAIMMLFSAGGADLSHAGDQEVDDVAASWMRVGCCLWGNGEEAQEVKAG